MYVTGNHWGRIFGELFFQLFVNYKLAMGKRCSNVAGLVTNGYDFEFLIILMLVYNTPSTHPLFLG
jgi:hypothetical protein